MYTDKLTKAVAEAYTKMKQEELKGNQDKIDVNHNGKIDSQDFKILRAQKNEEAELEPGQGPHLNLGGAKVKNTYSAVLAHVKKTFPNAKEITKHSQYGWGPKHEEAENAPFEGGRPVKERKPQPGQKTAPEYSRVRELARQALEKAAEKKTKNEAWGSKKPTVSEENGNLDEDLRKWFDKNDPEGGWKRINSKGEAIGPCAREPGEPKPKCMSNEKRAQLSKDERAAAVAAKRKHDPNPERKGKPINVSNFGKGKLGEDVEYIEEKNAPTNPELWSRAKALARQKFDVYPSAYANGWASKWYKSKGGGWKSVSEETEQKKHPFVAVHVKKGKHETHASTSYEAAQNAAKHWKLKNTAGISVYRAVDEEFELDEAFAVVGARENKRAFPGWLNVTRRGGKISSMDISRGEPKTVHDTEDAAKAHMDEIRGYLKNTPNHGWHTPSLSVKKVRKSTKSFRMEEELELDEGEVKRQNKQKKNAYVASIIQKKLHPSVLPSLAYGRRELKKEEIELSEGKMGELHADLQDTLDKHINAYKNKKLGHDQFGERVVAAHGEIAKRHNISHGAAQKFVNDYVDHSLNEMAVSTAQQKFMGMVYATKKGDMKAPSPEVAKAAASMTTKQARDFAKTKHEGLPAHVKKEEVELEEAYGKPSKAAGKANWMAKFEDHVVNKAPEHRGKVDWNSATYLHGQGHSPEAAAEKYVASRTKSEALGAERTKHIGEFQHAETKKHFTYSNTNNEWAKKHGLPHEIDVGPNAEGKRFAHVKGTVAHVSVDENDDGSPKIEKWKIRNHNKYQRESFSRKASMVKELFTKAKEKKNYKLKDKFEKDPDMEIMPAPAYTQAK